MNVCGLWLRDRQELKLPKSKTQPSQRQPASLFGKRFSCFFWVVMPTASTMEVERRIPCDLASRIIGRVSLASSLLGPQPQGRLRLAGIFLTAKVESGILREPSNLTYCRVRSQFRRPPPNISPPLAVVWEYCRSASQASAAFRYCHPYYTTELRSSNLEIWDQPCRGQHEPVAPKPSPPSSEASLPIATGMRSPHSLWWHICRG